MCDDQQRAYKATQQSHDVREYTVRQLKRICGFSTASEHTIDATCAQPTTEYEGMMMKTKNNVNTANGQGALPTTNVHWRRPWCTLR